MEHMTIEESTGEWLKQVKKQGGQQVNHPILKEGQMWKLKITEEKQEEDIVMKEMKDKLKHMTIQESTGERLKQVKKQGDYKMNHQKNWEIQERILKEGHMWKLKISETRRRSNDERN